MKWLVFSYSLPSKLGHNARVRLWRKLHKLGAIAPKSGVYILPNTPECLDALKWIALEVEQEQGDALLMQVDRFENLSDAAVLDLFKRERLQDYEEIESLLGTLESNFKKPKQDRDCQTVSLLQKGIKKLRKQIAELSRIDFFRTVDSAQIMARLQHLQKSLLAGNIVALLLFSVGNLDSVVLRKMKEEWDALDSKITVELKRTEGLMS